MSFTFRVDRHRPGDLRLHRLLGAQLRAVALRDYETAERIGLRVVARPAQRRRFTEADPCEEEQGVQLRRSSGMIGSEMIRSTSIRE